MIFSLCGEGQIVWMLAFPFEFRAEDYKKVTGQNYPIYNFTKRKVSNEMGATLGQNMRTTFEGAELEAKEYSGGDGCEMGPLMAMVLQRSLQC